jgi:predicted AAA+ superfamily ATPase
VNVTTADNSRVVADVQSRYGDISRQTVASYITALRRVFVIEEIPQWFTE